MFRFPFLSDHLLLKRSVLREAALAPEPRPLPDRILSSLAKALDVSHRRVERLEAEIADKQRERDEILRVIDAFSSAQAALVNSGVVPQNVLGTSEQKRLTVVPPQ